MEEARLYNRLPDDRVQCLVCQWRCRINSGHRGVCRMYENRGGVLYSLNYGRVSSLAADPVEKKPLYHFYPGTEVLSLGSLGCNFHCRHCQNWNISSPDNTSALDGCREISPPEAVQMAKTNHCRGIAWTYNEPAVGLEYTLDCARLAGEQGLYTVYVTNGFATAEALNALGPCLDAWRVDIKGFSDRLYRELAGIVDWRGILDTAVRAHDKWGMHLEVVTNVIPGWNDDNAQLNAIAAWIKTYLGELTPWHVTRFHPDYQLRDVPATPVDTLERAATLGREAGLKFVYVGNVPGHSGENTVCYNCGQMVVRREGYHTGVIGLKGSGCSNCGAELNFRNEESGGEH
jgi:pyruvate formate lyase activating enzyme